MKVIVKVLTEEGKYLLREIKGLEEGIILQGTRCKNNTKCFQFKWNNEDAVLWIGDNCESLAKPHSKEQYIKEIKEHLGCEFYQVLWCTPNFEYQCEDRNEARKHLKRGDSLICLIEFYERQDSDVRADYMHGKNEVDCLARLFKVLGLNLRSYRRKKRGYH